MYSVVLQKGHLDKSDTNIFSTGNSGGGSRIFIEGGLLSFKSDTNVCSIIIGNSDGGSRIYMRGGGSVVFKPDGYWVFIWTEDHLCVLKLITFEPLGRF